MVGQIVCYTCAHWWHHIFTVCQILQCIFFSFREIAGSHTRRIHIHFINMQTETKLILFAWLLSFTWYFQCWFPVSLKSFIIAGQQQFWQFNSFFWATYAEVEELCYYRESIPYGRSANEEGNSEVQGVRLWNKVPYCMFRSWREARSLNMVADDRSTVVVIWLNILKTCGAQWGVEDKF